MSQNLSDNDYDKPIFYGDRAMAEQLGVSKITVHRLRHQGKINYYQISEKRIAYSQRHLDEYLKKREVRDGWRIV
jgi:excisionase family DNA binding protein